MEDAVKERVFYAFNQQAPIILIAKQVILDVHHTLKFREI